eukprot:72544_1
MAWNIIGLVLEYYTIQIVYKNNPILATCALKAQQQEKEKELEKEKQLSYGSVSEESDGPKPTKVNENQVVKVTKSSLLMNRKRAKHNNITKLIDGWSFYMRSEMLWASISYCMLYMSVLDGGSLVAAYLRTEGISYSVLGITKGIGALFGILGTLLTPLLANTCG